MMKNQLHNIENLILHIPGNLYWKDRCGIFQGCNYQMAKIAKLSSPQQIIGKTIYDITEKSIADKITRSETNVMETGNSLEFEEDGLDISGEKNDLSHQETAHCR